MVVELVHTCSSQAAELGRLPFDAIAQIVLPNNTQRGALDGLRSIVAATVDKLTSECPREISYDCAGREHVRQTVIAADELAILPLVPLRAIRDDRAGVAVARRMHGRS